jgi:membrane protease YdiL (CAAX protease family)
MQLSSNQQAKPWGLGATSLFAVVIASVIVGVQLATESVLLHFQPVDADITGAGFLGLLLAVSTLVAAPVGIGLTVVAAHLRRGMALADYLSLRVPRMATVVHWFWYLVVFIALFHVAEYLLGRPFVTDFELMVFRTAYSVPLLLLAVVVAAPCLEELFFRGFILTGILASRLGVVGALFFTAALWAIMHAAQYAPTELFLIFLGGLLLGYARWKTRSIYVPIGLHALWNLVSAVETMIYLTRSGAVPATA